MAAKTTTIALAVLLLIGTRSGFAQTGPCGGDPPPTPASILEMVYARPFTLETPYQSHWREERPLVRSGYLVVIKVDPAFAIPRAGREPVLYAGDQTIERVNVGQGSGYVIGILPGKASLAGMRIWYGEAGFPETVNAGTISRNRGLALGAGIRPVSGDQIRRARAAGGRRLRALTKSELLSAVAPLILAYSPEERDLALTLQGRPPED